MKAKKFTKKAFRLAIRQFNQTMVWYLASLKFGRTPNRNEVYELVHEIADTVRGYKRAYTLAYGHVEDSRYAKNYAADNTAFYKRSRNLSATLDFQRGEALKMLRRLATEDVTGYTKVPLFGFHHLYFCSPSYGHRDYNKVRTCVLNGPLANDKNGNRYDQQAAWCDKILDLGKRIYFKKTGTNYADQPGLPAPLIDSL